MNLPKPPTTIVYFNAGCTINQILSVVDYSLVAHGGHNSSTLTATINTANTIPAEIAIGIHNIEGASIVIDENSIVATGNLESIVFYFSNYEIYLHDIHITMFDA